MRKEIVEKIIIDNLDSSQIKEIKPWKGKSTNVCYIVDTECGRYFLKCRPKLYERLYGSQANGLNAIKRMDSIRVPEVFRYGMVEEWSFIILGWLPLSAHTKQSKRILGEELAKMHQIKAPFAFGFFEDNYLDETLQNNAWSKDWVQFLQNERFIPLVKWIEDEELKSLFRSFIERMPRYFENVDIRPSMLHGNLWPRNTFALPDGLPVLVDPAVYYGHHEVDIALLTLEGGLGEDFSKAYHAILPKAEGFELRRMIYQLLYYLNSYPVDGANMRPICMGLLEKLL